MKRIRSILWEALLTIAGIFCLIVFMPLVLVVNLVALCRKEERWWPWEVDDESEDDDECDCELCQLGF